MNHNGTLAIIFFIYLMTTLPLLFKNGSARSCPYLVYGTLASGSQVNLYSRFKERLNATSNLAKSEYDTKTSVALNSIYDLAGDILSQQLKRARTASDSQNGNYADKLFDGANLFGSQYIPPRAVASSNNNASTTTNAATDADADGSNAEKKVQLINSPVVVSNANQSNHHHRQARKIQKASRIFQRSPRRKRRRRWSRMKNFNLYPRTSTGKRQSSRARSPSFSLTPNAGRGKISTISSKSQEMPYYGQLEQRVAKKNIDDNYSKLRGARSSLVHVGGGSGQKTNGLAVESIDSGCDGDSSKTVGSSSLKWRRKLQIDGRQNNLQKCGPLPILFGKDQSNGFIQSSEDTNEEVEEKNGVNISSMENDETRKCTRSADSFPEVFSRPSVDSNSVPIIGATGNELNEAIKNINSLLTTGQGVARNSNTPIIDLENTSRRIGKQTQTFTEAPLNGLKAAPGINPVMEDTTTANFTNVMEKVLDELESLKECKAAADDMQPEGSPCDVAGSWNSETIGLQFHISMTNPSPSSRTFVEGKRIEIELTERIPPRRHDLMACDWFLTGSTVKQVGGPFYMTAQKADRFIVATFAGLCKTCGGIPTIFGSWTFVYPAKDCQDISLAVENRRDILRRDNLEAKRKHRRDRVNSKDKGKCSHSLF